MSHHLALHVEYHTLWLHTISKVLVPVIVIDEGIVIEYRLTRLLDILWVIYVRMDPPPPKQLYLLFLPLIVILLFGSNTNSILSILSPLEMKDWKDCFLSNNLVFGLLLVLMSFLRVWVSISSWKLIMFSFYDWKALSRCRCYLHSFIKI